MLSEVLLSLKRETTTNSYGADEDRNNRERMYLIRPLIGLLSLQMTRHGCASPVALVQRGDTPA